MHGSTDSCLPAERLALIASHFNPGSNSPEMAFKI
jgi:hypothetical protein